MALTTSVLRYQVAFLVDTVLARWPLPGRPRALGERELAGETLDRRGPCQGQQSLELFGLDWGLLACSLGRQDPGLS